MIIRMKIMKKYIFVLLSCSIILSGCGNSNNDNWQNQENFGDINLEAQEQERNDFDEKWLIDDYISLSEQNQSRKEEMILDNYRLYYNKAAEQCGFPFLYLYEITAEQKDSYTINNWSKDGVGNYIYTDEKGYIAKIKSEIPFSYGEGTDLTYEKCVANVLAPIYGGVPYLKKYDINKIYEELIACLDEERASYETSFNNIDITVTREFGYVTVVINL